MLKEADNNNNTNYKTIEINHINDTNNQQQSWTTSHLQLLLENK